MEKHNVTIICGPTAVGKTALAMEWAKKNNAEIISADSGQIYRGMDIGTAKPTPAQRKEVSFHLLDIIDPGERFSAADFRRLALEAIDDIQSRGKRAVVAGGTGLYLKALEEGIFEGPSANPFIRQKLERRMKEQGVESLHEELQRVDPEAAAAIPKGNKQRLIRALEVYQVAGKPISEFWREHSEAIQSRSQGSELTFEKIGLSLPKEELHRRIEARVDDMVQEGLVKEVEMLLEEWGDNAPGLKIIGYKEIISHVRGHMDLDDAVALIKLRTRQYAKRQMTWFRKDSEIKWKDPTES